jgi:hypothetical protein
MKTTPSSGPASTLVVSRCVSFPYQFVLQSVFLINICATELSWLLTRERVPSADILAAADAVIAANGLNASKYQLTDQTGCPPDDQM